MDLTDSDTEEYQLSEIDSDESPPRRRRPRRSQRYRRLRRLPPPGPPVGSQTPWDDLKTQQHYDLGIGGYDAIQEYTDLFRFYNPTAPHAPIEGEVYPIWDGIPVDYAGKTQEELQSVLFVHEGTSGNLKGLEQLYNEVQPFSDPMNPDVTEIEYWNYKVLCHVRKMLNINVDIVLDRCKHLFAQFALEYMDANGPASVLPVATSYKSCSEQAFYDPDYIEPPFQGAPPFESELPCCEAEGVCYHTWMPPAAATFGPKLSWFWLFQRMLRHFLSNNVQTFLNIVAADSIGVAWNYTDESTWAASRCYIVV